MTAYSISDLNPQTKFCEITAIFDVATKSMLELAIPRWRPARYSLQNYAELIQEVKFFDQDNQLLPYTKLDRDTWLIQTTDLNKVRGVYRFYANQFEAGGSFIDEDFVLLNPVNCLMYDKNSLDQECNLEVFGEGDWESCGITDKIQKQVQHDTTEGSNKQVPFLRGQAAGLGVVSFKDYHLLVDTPLLLVKKNSLKLKNLNFEVKDLENGKIEIEVVIYGQNKLDLVKVEADFKAFISEQVKIFRTIAVKNYTFLCILPDFFDYHGVEHQNSSVNIFGPGYTVHKDENYKRFLGICCHEFFHHWNIKSMRPKELNTYDYSQEQLFTTGYVAEGFTTLYGDLILYRAGLINLDEMATILSKAATAHIQNFGRFKASMRESSLDLWLDGYKAGIPDDKVNIYTEGCLLALILNAKIRKESNNHSSLDRLLYEMFVQFGQQKNGYSEQDLIDISNKLSQTDLAPFFQEFYGSKVDLTHALSASLESLGLKLEIKDCDKSYEAEFGFKINPNGEKLEIVKIYPSSSSYQKLSLLDQVIAVNNKTLNPRNYGSLFEYFQNESIQVLVSRSGELIKVELEPDRSRGLKKVVISKL